MNEIIYIGNYIYEGSQCGVVISSESKVFTCLNAGTHGYSQSNILVVKEDESRNEYSDMDI